MASIILIKLGLSRRVFLFVNKEIKIINDEVDFK